MHPRVRQKETIMFHRVRTVISLAGLSHNFISRLTRANQSALSQYLRCSFNGRQDKLEYKLDIFVQE